MPSLPSSGGRSVVCHKSQEREVVYGCVANYRSTFRNRGRTVLVLLVEQALVDGANSGYAVFVWRTFGVGAELRHRSVYLHTVLEAVGSVEVVR